jgi:hypothetical protein
MRLRAAPRALIGNTVTFEVDHVDPSALGTALVMNVGDVDPGVDLDSVGMPGCKLYVTLPFAGAFTMSGGPTPSFQYPIPWNPSFVGIAIDSQVAALVPGVNSLGVLGSNGLLTVVGLF